jgi:membrane fusion protein (multidrug efflux system)
MPDPNCVLIFSPTKAAENPDGCVGSGIDHEAKMSKPILLTVPVFALGALLLVGCGKPKTDAKAAKGPAPVRYVVVQTAPLQLTEDLAGRTSAFLDSDVRPQVGGIIKAWLFTEGGVVKAE